MGGARLGSAWREIGPRLVVMRSELSAIACGPEIKLGSRSFIQTGHLESAFGAPEFDSRGSLQWRQPVVCQQRPILTAHPPGWKHTTAATAATVTVVAGLRLPSAVSPSDSAVLKVHHRVVESVNATLDHTRTAAPRISQLQGWRRALGG